MSCETPTAPPLISVVMPVRNEGAYIDKSFDALDRQTYPRDLIEIIVVDGGSTDDTVDRVRRRAATDSRIRLLGGPGVNTPTAMNIGIDAASGEFVAKVDGHGWINEPFLEVASSAMRSAHDVGCVGGEVVPVAETQVQVANQIARFSKLGVGAGIYTAPRFIHDIDTVQCGVYRREVLIHVGSFDSDLQFGEDEEVNHRVRGSGARILFVPEMRFYYLVRPSHRSLFRQYFNYGRARVKVVRKHRDFLRPKHLIPAATVLALVAAPIVGVFVDVRIGIVVVGGYVIAVVVGAIALSIRRRFPRPDLVALSLACLHIGYGLGTYAGLGDLLRPRR